MITLGLLIAGLVGLVLGTNLIIRGAVNIAEHYKVSQFFIGLTVLTVGTNLPELVVVITAAVHRIQGVETSGLVIGETIGTCFGQIALAMGILGLFAVLTLKKRQLLRDGLMMVGSVALLFFLAIDGNVDRFDGAVFIIVYIIYFFNLHREEIKREKKQRAKKLQLGWVILSLFGGFFILIFASDIVVFNAVSLAEYLNVSQDIIGIFIIGLGTSLPEIAVLVGSIWKKNVTLSIGNLIGSNTFDVLFALGIGAIISGFNVNKNFINFDIPFLFFTSVIVVLFFGRKKRMVRKEAAFLLIVYFVYMFVKLGYF